MIGTCTALLVAITIFAVAAILECVRLYNELFIVEKRVASLSAELAKTKRLCP